MTLAGHMEMMLNHLGMKPADIKECLPHVIQTLKQDSVFRDYYEVDCWEQSIEHFELREMMSIFHTNVLPEAFRWLTYQYYDAIDER